MRGRRRYRAKRPSRIMHNLILAAISLLFVSTILAGGVTYFRPALFARIEVGDVLATGFGQLGSAWAAYFVANGTAPLGQSEAAGCWWDQFDAFGNLPPIPAELPVDDDGCGGGWHYDRSVVNGQPYFCVNLEDSAANPSPEVANFLFTAVRKSVTRFADNTGTVNQQPIMLSLYDCAVTADAIDQCDGADGILGNADDPLDSECADNIAADSTANDVGVNLYLDWAQVIVNGGVGSDISPLLSDAVVNTHPDGWPTYDLMVSDIRQSFGGISIVYWVGR